LRQLLFQLGDPLFVRIPRRRPILLLAHLPSVQSTGALRQAPFQPFSLRMFIH
jgi:hypothetical protein